MNARLIAGITRHHVVISARIVSVVGLRIGGRILRPTVAPQLVVAVRPLTVVLRGVGTPSGPVLLLPLALLVKLLLLLREIEILLVGPVVLLMLTKGSWFIDKLIVKLGGGRGGRRAKGRSITMDIYENTLRENVLF